MTQEEKELLLKDICARLPYGVRMKGVNEDFELSINTSPKRLSYVLNSVDFKPYLRPMSSMTEEESKEFGLLQTDFYVDGFLYPIAAVSMINWLNAHHFDYNYLIEKGLALEAPNGMYN